MSNNIENLTSDITFETAYSFQLGVTFIDAFGNVSLGGRVRPQSPDRDDMLGTACRAVGTTV